METIVTKLIYDEDYKVRAALAANPHVPAASLQILEDDASPHVREILAICSNCPAQLRRLANDPDDCVRARARANEAGNANCGLSPEAPQRRATFGNAASLVYSAVRDFFTESAELKRAKRLSTLAGVLDRLAIHGNEHVRLAVAENPNVDRQTMEYLAADKSARVRAAVAEFAR